MSSSTAIPPVQLAYFAERGEPVPYTINATSRESREGDDTAGNIESQHPPLPPYVANHEAPAKMAIRGLGYFRVMLALQTIFQFGILVCMIAVAAKVYQTPSLNLNSARF